VASVVVAAAVLALSGAAGGGLIARRVHVPGRISVRVPVGWHVLHGWLSPVVDPAPMLSFASYRARLSRRACECGFPNVVDFPRDGAFVFVWEYLFPSRRMLARSPSRPARFLVAAGRGVRRTCDGPTDGFVFKDAGRVFQVEVYLGPAVGTELRRQAAQMFDSLRVAPDAAPEARRVPTD
jgi:hypothetical protein